VQNYNLRALKDMDAARNAAAFSALLAGSSLSDAADE
jgi:hypothetical protein